MGGGRRLRLRNRGTDWRGSGLGEHEEKMGLAAERSSTLAAETAMCHRNEMADEAGDVGIVQPNGNLSLACLLGRLSA